MTVRRARVLLAAGIVTTMAGLAWAHARVWASEPYPVTGTSRFGWMLAFAAISLVLCYGAGLPDLPRTRRGAALAATAAMGVSVLVVSGFQLALGQALLPRFVVFGAVVVLVPWTTLVSGLVIGRRARGDDGDRVVVVGDWGDAAALARELAQGAERSARIIDVLTPADAAATSAGSQPLRESVETGAADVVVLDRFAQLDRSVVEQVAALHEAGVRVRTLSLFYEEWLGKLPISELERVSLMFDIGEVHRIRYGRYKRVVDVTLAAVGSLALVLALPLVAVGNLVANRGPLLFRQERVGKHGRAFTMYKFRTMRTGPEGAGAWTETKDLRVTPFGSLLRRSHLDELPQVWNVLRGDLSVIGPRPEQPAYVAELKAKLPFYDLRHLVRPGLTGWAQVKYGYAASADDALEKLQYEFYYLRHQRPSLDGRIVARTLRAVVRGSGR